MFTSHCQDLMLLIIHRCTWSDCVVLWEENLKESMTLHHGPIIQSAIQCSLDNALISITNECVQFTRDPNKNLDLADVMCFHKGVRVRLWWQCYRKEKESWIHSFVQLHILAWNPSFHKFCSNPFTVFEHSPADRQKDRQNDIKLTRNTTSMTEVIRMFDIIIWWWTKH